TFASDVNWGKAGREMAWAQFELPQKNPVSDIEYNDRHLTLLSVKERQTHLHVHGSHFELVFNTISGQMETWDYEGVPLIKTGPKLQFWRAMTDNDHRSARMWKQFGVHWLQQCMDKVTWEVSDDKTKVMVNVSGRIAPPI